MLKTNVEATKRQLQQRKSKKLNYLKHKPQPIKEQTPAITQANFKKFYAMPLRETPTSSIQKFNICKKQAKQTSKKNHQFS